MTDIDQMNITTVVESVAEAWGVTIDDLTGRSGRRPYTTARNAAYALCTELTGESTVAIGRYLGGRDHTTVLSGTKVAKWYSGDNLAKMKRARQLALDGGPGAFKSIRGARFVRATPTQNT